MLQYKKNYNDLKPIIQGEKSIIDSYSKYVSALKISLEKYNKNCNKYSFENESLISMLLNNFEMAIIQTESILNDINILSNMIVLSEEKEGLSQSDVKNYNDLFKKVTKDIKNTQNFLEKTMNSFFSVSGSGNDTSIVILKEFKNNILKNSPLVEDKGHLDVYKPLLKNINKKLDASSSDLQFFFPKDNSDNLTLSTSQSNYKLSFNGKLATVSIAENKYNIALSTPILQICNNATNTVLFVCHSESKYTIITNQKMEIEFLPSTLVSKISKSDDRLEIEILNDVFSLNIKDNIIYFDEFVAPESQHSEAIAPVEAETNEIINSVIDKTTDIVSTKQEEVINTETVVEPKENKITDNDTLIISDSNKNIILPYKVSELEKKLKQNKKYSTIQEVIDKEYTIPAENFKNPIRSRFREAFQLIKRKEKGSFKEAFELGMELMFQSDLNPAIIAACKDLDELDVYLDCLDDNETDKFNGFKIIYNMPPTKKLAHS